MPIDSTTWLGRLERALWSVDNIHVSRVDAKTMTFALGFQSVIVHVEGERAYAALSSDGGGTIAEGQHLEDQVTHLPQTIYAIEGMTVMTAAAQIAMHLTGEPPFVERRRTLAESYEVTDWFKVLTGTVNPGRAAARERFLALRYQGRPFGEWVPPMRDDDPSEIEYTKEFAEGTAFAHLAVAANLDSQIINIESRQPPEPDLRVALADGAHVWVEVAQVTESASTRYFKAIDAVNQHLRRKERSDADYLGEIQGRHVAVNLPNAPPKNRSREAADEIVALVRSIDFETVQRRTLIAIPVDVAPYLTSLRARFYVGDGISTSVRAQNGANCFSPDDSADDFNSILETKTGKTYCVDAPLWLALYLTDLRQVPDLTMNAIRARALAGTGQFARVIVGTLVDAEVFAR